MRRSLGFSLVELSVVLTILAVVAGTVAIRAHVITRRAETEGVIRKIGAFDRRVRTLARQKRKPVRLLIEADRDRLRCLSRRDQDEVVLMLDLHSGCQITGVGMAGETGLLNSASMPISSRGLSRSYALGIRGVDGRERWLLIVGFAGQMIELEGDEQEAMEILNAIANRPDAD